MNRYLAAILAAIFGATLLAPTAAADSAPGADGFVRGAYRTSSDPSLFHIADTGFNAVTVNPSLHQLNELAAHGLKGVVWMFGYSNSTCSFAQDDDWVRARLAEIGGHPAILAYQIDDEPNAVACPNAPEQMRARHELVRSLDPSKPTYLTVSSWNGIRKYPYRDFVGSSDIMGLVVYPCSFEHGCRFGIIGEAIAAAVNDGVERFWAIPQAFEDSWYQVPTPEQLATQFDLWNESGFEGYFVYHWTWGELATSPEHLAVLREQNLRAFGNSPPEEGRAPPAPPGNLTAIWLGRHVLLSWSASVPDSGAVEYRVRRNGRDIGRTERLRFADRPPSSRSHTYSVIAIDAAGNVSEPTSVIDKRPARPRRVRPRPTRASRLKAARPACLPSRPRHSFC